MTSSISRFIIGASATAVLVISLFLPGAAQAQRGPGARAGSVQQHQRTQMRQIRKGLQGGALNKQQAAKLARSEKNIQATEARDRANGPLTSGEAKQIRRETKGESAAIKHDEGDHNATPPSH